MPTPKKTTKPTVHETETAVDEVVEPAERTDQEKRESRAERDEMLADMPTLRAPTAFRLRHRNDFNALKLNVIEKAGAPIDTEDGDAFARARGIVVAQGAMADIDEWAESIAVDPKAYAEWSTSLDKDSVHDTMLALFLNYQEDLGE